VNKFDLLIVDLLNIPVIIKDYKKKIRMKHYNERELLTIYIANICRNIFDIRKRVILQKKKYCRYTKKSILKSTYEREREKK
jgi:hypothetical protein